MSTKPHSTTLKILRPDMITERSMHKAGLSQIVFGAVKEAVKWAVANFPITSPEGEVAREEACTGKKSRIPCPHWDPKGYDNMGKCNLCGCSQMLWKIATKQCPDNPPRFLAEVDKKE